MSALPLRLLAPGDPELAQSSSLAVARRHVEEAAPGDATHEAHRRTVLEFVDQHADALERTCERGHLTGSGLVVEPSTGRMLLMLHAKLRRWFQPGGHADGDASLPGVALREASEESGIAGLRVAVPALDIDVHAVPPPHGPHLHLDVRYLVLAPPGAVPAGNHESLDLRWVTPDELPSYGADPGLLRAAAAAFAALPQVVPV